MATASYFYKTLSDGTACTNSVFGDPVVGTAKQCAIGALAPPPSTWTFCAREGGFCAFAGTTEVRYGGNGVYSYKTLSNGTACTNSVFGDPVAGTTKMRYRGASAPPPSTWTFCAPEGGFCAFAGTTEVRYGGNGVYAYKTLSDGTACTNSVFGDPVAGTAKQCATGAASPSPPLPPPSPSAVGPQATITCPAGAVDIFPGIDIQGIVNLYTGNTTFCLRAGIHSRDELDHAEDRQYVRRRVRRDPGRHRMDNDGRHAGGVPGPQRKHRQRDDPQSRHPQHAAAGHPCVLLDVR